MRSLINKLTNINIENTLMRHDNTPVSTFQVASFSTSDLILFYTKLKNPNFRKSGLKKIMYREKEAFLIS